jgi:hypothetical protein
MRFFLTALIWLIMFGGLSLYIYQRDRHAPEPIQAPVRQAVAGEDFTLEITPTFSPEADPFALQGNTEAGASLLVRTAEQVLFRGEALEPGVPVRVNPVPGLIEGRNELYLQAQPPLGESSRDHAVRVRLLQDSRVVVDETLWGRSGANVAGTMPFTLAEMAEEHHDH